MVLILSIIIVFLIAYQLYSFTTGKPVNSPPGIPRLPIWGSYWFLLWGDYKFPYKTMNYYVKKYKSKIIGLYLGDAYTIVVNDYESIKNVLSRKVFDGRVNDTHIKRARAYGKKMGIFFNDDDEWLKQRRFALRNMRDFGFGRRHEKLESIINSQVAILVATLNNGPANELEKTVVNNGLAYFPDVLYPSCANSIWFVMSGEICEPDENENLRNLCRSAMLFQRSVDTTGGAITFTPWLRHFGDGFGTKGFVKASYAIADFAKNFVNKRRNAVDEEPKIDGFIDVYLNEMKKYEVMADFTDEQLLVVVVDFMFPPMSAVPSMLTHYIKYMMHNPRVMKKVQCEIDDVVGRNRLPEWNDRINLPYTEASMREVLRIDTATPWSVAHRATETTTLMGYDVPANTPVITNLAEMHNDPDLWGDPENFRPERFLTDDEKHLVKDLTLPFGFGRRVCAGETFARFVLFAHIAALMQNFNFEFVAGEPTNLDDNFPGITTTPKETWIRVSPR